MSRKTGVPNTKNKRFKEETVIEPQEQKGGFFDFLKFGESYTSLILGIVVVIIATVLLLSFVQNRNISNRVKDPSQIANQQNQPNNQKVAVVSPTTVVTKAPTSQPTKIIVKKTNPTPTIKPEQKKIVAVKVTPAKTPTKALAQKATPTPGKISAAKTVNNNVQKTYTVAEGDSLWSIAEKNYSNGHKWVEIARANNLSNPDTIYKGNKLVLPKDEQKITTVTPAPTTSSVAGNTKGGIPQATTSAAPIVTNKITGNSYTVAKGDNLWDIAVRSYGDGYQWVKIAKENNLANPNVIHSGNNLKIPRV